MVCTHPLLFSHLWDPQPLLAQQQKASAHLLGRAAHARGTFPLKKVLEFTAEVKELKRCVKLLASAINSH